MHSRPTRRTRHPRRGFKAECRLMLAILLALQLHAPGDHPAGDSWFGVDKVKHFFMGAFVQSVAYTAVRTTGASHTASLVAASGVTAGVSIGKEIWDAHGNGTPS